MRKRSPAEVAAAPTSPSMASVEARRALEQAGRLQRNGDLAGAIALYQKGIALVAESEDSEGIRIRVRLRMQKESADRMRRQAERAE